MTSTIEHQSRPALSAVLDRARDAVAARRRADRDLLVAALDWALARPASPHDVAGWGEVDLYGEGFLPLAGDGAPPVAEFAPCELAAELGWSTDAAKRLMGDALELHTRLPGLWGMVGELTVPVHVARHAAEHTRDLAPEAAAHADRLLTRAAARSRLSQRRVTALVDEARLYHDPDRALDDEHRALAARKVQLTPGQTPATTDVVMTLDTLDGVAFDRAVSRGAAALKALGDTDSVDVRRARAVGILADPQRALDLLAGVDPGHDLRVTPTATLYLHLDQSALLDFDTFPAAIGVDGVGTLSSDLLATWLAGSTVVVKPVLDLTRPDAVDGHDPPAWMADLVRLRDPVCVFPGCRRPSRSCDLDHIEPYLSPDEGGPPGQTRPDNLAPLCRHHHRAKTHGQWHYRRMPGGGYRWTSPRGRTHLVAHPARPDNAVMSAHP